MGTLWTIRPLALALTCAGASAANTIAPTGPVVPANLLRIEVHFDQPMPHIDPRAVALLDASGKPIADALLDFVLPDAGARNLVVLMQPGRIKHGVGPNLALGPALREGDRISIEVSDPRLPQRLIRNWRVTAPVARRLDPGNWRVHAPAPRGMAPLVLDLPDAINASGAVLIGVAGADGRRVAGKARLAAGETQWRFVPEVPWKRGSYSVRVHPDLEDPAGNRLCAAFEERLQSARACGSGTRLDFRIGAP